MAVTCTAGRKPTVECILFGGLACRMAQVQYKTNAVSPHSGMWKEAGELEWVRVEEVDPAKHEVLREQPKEWLAQTKGDAS